MHRAPKGTKFTIDVLAPTTLWVCFYPGTKYSGGYDQIFKGLDDWEACEEILHYHNSPKTGKDGKRMIRYRCDVQDAGKVEIPATTSENGVMAIVIKAME